MDDVDNRQFPNFYVQATYGDTKARLVGRKVGSKMNQSGKVIITSRDEDGYFTAVNNLWKVLGTN